MNHGRLLLRARSAPWPFLECRGRSVLVHHSPAGSCSFSHLIRKSLPRTSPKVDQNRHLVSATPSLQQQETGSDSSLPQPPHVSVLLDETLAAFEDMRVATYVDGTLGAAGHAIGMVQQHPELTTLIGFDLDTTAHRIAGERLASVGAHLVPVEPRRNAAGKVVSIPPIQTTGASPQPTAYVVHSNFESMQTILSRLPSPENPLAACSSDGGLVGAVDAVLLDLGMSSMQVDESDRGFSFMRDGPLDMRMDTSAGASAEDLVNGASEVELGRIFKEYGEERYWKSIARRVVSFREEQPISTTQQLVKAIGNPGGGGRGRRDAKQKHPATRVFQALRIAVNGELQSIAQVLPDAIHCLRPGGRLAVITFHSLEDRIVKWAFRQAAGMAPSDEALPSYCVPFTQPLDQPLVRIITRRPLVPSQQEQDANSRSRSAKLRVVEKL